VTFDIADIQKLMETQEELAPELEQYLDDGPLGGRCLRHPLVYSIFWAPQMNAMLNEQFRQKRAAVIDARRQENWHGFVYLHERPYRLDAFVDTAWRMRDQEYWEILGGIYIDTENLWQNKDQWVECLTADRRLRSRLMRAEDRVTLQSHDPVIEVYRGYNSGGTVDGLSWTTSADVARFFARRLADTGATMYLSEGRVKRARVLAYFNGRSEQEMLVLPGGVKDITTKTLGVQE